MRFLYPLFVLLSLLAACAAPRRAEHFYRKNLRHDIQNSPVFANGFTGFVLMDAASGRVLCDVNGDHYFTPASNLKILTLATCLAVLGDSVPGLQYYTEGDYLIFRGTADPTFLHPEFRYWQTGYRVLAQAPQRLLILDRAFNEPRFGPGWAWDDYSESFQTERSAFPVYGNTVRLLGLSGGRFEVQPPSFRSSAQYTYYGRPEKEISRREGDNLIELRRPLKEGEEIVVPYRPPQWEYIMEDTLRRNDVEPARYAVEIPEKPDWTTLYSTPLDTVLRRMMFQSDNFIAEQMLLVCAGVKFDTLDQDPMIRWAKDSLPARGLASRPPRWVDGSGLSRYNLATPAYLATVLHELWLSQPRERLFSLFPTAGAPGTTLDWWQPLPAQPWLYAKTGSMSGVQCISGYLVTRRGKVLIFSFMNNNFVGPGRPWKEEMRRILEKAHDF